MIPSNPLLQIDVREQLSRAPTPSPHRFPPETAPSSESCSTRQSQPPSSTPVNECMTRTGSCRSPARTRLPPLPGCRAPNAVAGSHAGAGSAPRAPLTASSRRDARRDPDRPHAPSSRSPGPTARTPATTPPARGRPHQVDHLSSKLRRIRPSMSRPVNTSCSREKVSTEPGQLHSICSCCRPSGRSSTAPSSELRAHGDTNSTPASTCPTGSTSCSPSSTPSPIALTTTAHTRPLAI
jgi:hypothetical protein